MAMSYTRKKSQDKLRRKYNYETNTNYGRGTVLIKKIRNNRDYDVAIVMNHNLYCNENPIEVISTRYDKDGKELDSRYFSLSLEELDLIHTIAHEMEKESNWNGQFKNLKKIKKLMKEGEETNNGNI